MEGEYVQMTLDDWMAIKSELEADLEGVSVSFVRIGFNLRKIRDGQLYKQDGYANMEDFAKQEYNLSGSTTSRFIAINKKYSVGGYSKELRPEFASIGSSKLSEMLTLPDSDLSLIRPETTRETIRELKGFERQNAEPEPGTFDLTGLVESFADANDIWDDLGDLLENGDEKEIADRINPSGNKTFRKGKYFVFFREDHITVKIFGKDQPEEVSWRAWINALRILWTEEKEDAAIIAEESQQNAAERNEDMRNDTPENVNDTPENVDTTTETVSKPQETVSKPQESESKPPVQEDEPKKAKVAPAQESEECLSNTRQKSNSEPSQKETEAPAQEAVMPAPKLQKRREFMRGLTDWALAVYIIDSINTIPMNSIPALQMWLQDEVDENGKEIIEQED